MHIKSPPPHTHIPYNIMGYFVHSHDIQPHVSPSESFFKALYLYGLRVDVGEGLEIMY